MQYARGKSRFKVPGVTSCSVSLLTNSMGIEGTASEQDIVKAVTDAGYGASKREAKRQEMPRTAVCQQAAARLMMRSC